MSETTDLLDRLAKATERVPIDFTATGLFSEAHDEIKRLRALIDPGCIAVSDTLARYSDELAKERDEARDDARTMGRVAQKAQKQYRDMQEQANRYLDERDEMIRALEARERHDDGCDCEVSYLLELVARRRNTERQEKLLREIRHEAMTGVTGYMQRILEHAEAALASPVAGCDNPSHQYRYASGQECPKCPSPVDPHEPK